MPEGDSDDRENVGPTSWYQRQSKKTRRKKNIRFWWKDKEERNVEVRCRVEQAGLGSCLLPLMWEQRNSSKKN